MDHIQSLSLHMGFKFVPVRKKSVEIRMCVDFRNVNHVSNKENYSVPTMDHILQTISRAQMFSLLNGFSGYNQVLVVEPNRLKTTFRTKWGTFAYKIMLFGLVNVGKTFQHAMDITFMELIKQSVVVYLDDMTMFSRRREDHICHLKKFFE